MALLDDIKQTIKYASKFGGEITLEQLYIRLLSDKSYSKEEIVKIITNYKLRRACRQAGITNKKISKTNIKKIKLAKDLVKKHLEKFKNILMVAITGSVAAENARKGEDIDLFIICKKETMWLTRLMLRIYIKMHNIPHRKFGQKERSNDFCFNLWMDENDMLVPKGKQNQKNAVDLIMMKIIFNKNNVYEQFLAQNSWVKKYVANGYGLLAISNFQFTISKEETSIIKKLLNYIAFFGQYLYIRLKGPIKFINLTQAFFHK